MASHWKVRKVHLVNVVIHLMVRFKGETRIQHHLQSVMNKTALKINVRWWIETLNNEFISQVQINGP